MNNERRLEIYLRPITKHFTDEDGFFRVTGRQKKRLRKKANKAEKQLQRYVAVKSADDNQ